MDQIANEGIESAAGASSSSQAGEGEGDLMEVVEQRHDQAPSTASSSTIIGQKRPAPSQQMEESEQQGQPTTGGQEKEEGPDPKRPRLDDASISTSTQPPPPASIAPTAAGSLDGPNASTALSLPGQVDGMAINTISNGQHQEQEEKDEEVEILSTTTPTTVERKAEDPAAAPSRSPSPSMTYTCPLCLSLLVRPVTLECGSSLCESCVAQTLHRAWAVDGRRAAPCPVLGPSCPCGPVHRLPRVNALLHNDLSARYPSHYADRLTEVQATPVKELVDRVQVRSERLARAASWYSSSSHRQWGMRTNARMINPRAVIAARLLRGEAHGDGSQEGRIRQTRQGGAREGLDDHLDDEYDNVPSDEEIRQPLAHMRFTLPLLMAIVASSLLVPGRGPYSGLANNGFALLLSSCAGAHWWLWSYLGQPTIPLAASGAAATTTATTRVTAAGGGREGVPLLLTLPPEALREMRRYRSLLSDFGLRIRIAGDFPPGLGFCCTWLLLASVLDMMAIWIRLSAMRWRRERVKGGSAVWCFVTEILVLIGAWLYYEALSLTAYRMQDWVSPGAHAMLADPRVQDLYCVAWYLGVFARIVLGPFTPQPTLHREAQTLERLDDLPPWKALLLDPRLDLLHSQSGMEVKVLGAVFSWVKNRLLCASHRGEGGQQQQEQVPLQHQEQEAQPQPHAGEDNVEQEAANSQPVERRNGQDRPQEGERRREGTPLLEPVSAIANDEVARGHSRPLIGLGL